jgi:urease accessory protein
MNLLLWQLIDSGFPSGGFAHSAGLEAAMQHGQVKDDAGVERFARQSLMHAGRSALPLMTAVYNEPASMPALDRLTDVFLSNPVANRASRAQGRALLASALSAFENGALAALDVCVRRERLAAHYAPVFGAVLNAMCIGLDEGRRAFLFVAIRNVTSAAVKLGLVGPYRAQQIHAQVVAHIELVINECGALGPYDIAQTAPLVDLFQSTHDRLYSRLFQS